MHLPYRCSKTVFPVLVIAALFILSTFGVMKTAACADQAHSNSDHILAHPDQPGWTRAFKATNGDLFTHDTYVEACFPAGAQGALELTSTADAADWSGYAGISFQICNISDSAVNLRVYVESGPENGRALQSRRTISIPEKASLKLPFYFTNNNVGPYWGMRGIPVYYQMATTLFEEPGTNLYLPRVTRAGFELEASSNPVCIRIHQVTLFKPNSPLAELVPHPFIDAYGQYMHANWRGKIHDDAELRASALLEGAALEDAPFPLALDAFGGWLDGPRLEATGWFRTELIDGRWWLVTPEGRLFLSMGVNCVHYGNSTFVEGRDAWFAALPDADGPFAGAYGHVSGVHSLAGPIGGQGRTLNHYRLNLHRKYGDDWHTRARLRAEKRLRAWGFNTIGNWSDGNIVAGASLPFTLTAASGDARVITGGTGGYWGRMKDVFDPDFADNTDAALARSLAGKAELPRVIGVFVDNELSWTNIAASALDSPPDQPARIAFIEMLQEEYTTLDALNGSWDCNAASWDSLTPPSRPNRAFRDDSAAFDYLFAKRYFDTVAAALRRHAPNYLYLGCRFTPMYCPAPVLRACAETVDVVSLNLYYKTVPSNLYADLGKPVIIGEFHFGALDRGMFHTGLQAAADQEERAAFYTGYVESLMNHPAVVGAQWFQYMDQPTTGRTLDGENYNIGLVNIVDVPYAELTTSARDIHSRMYRLRYHQ